MQATTIATYLDDDSLSGPSASTQTIHRLTSLHFHPLEWLPLHFKANLNPYCAYRVLKGLALKPLLDSGSTSSQHQLTGLQSHLLSSCCFNRPTWCHHQALVPAAPSAWNTFQALFPHTWNATSSPSQPLSLYQTALFIFLPSTHHHLKLPCSSICLFLGHSLPFRIWAPCKQGPWLPCSLLNLQFLKWHLVYCRWSINIFVKNICWMNNDYTPMF